MRQVDYRRSRQDWNGIEIEVTWCPDWLAFDDGTGMGHLQIRSVAPERGALPITETGYRSHFIHADEIASHGGPDEFVRRWLAHAAKSPAWRDTDAAGRQGTLF